MSADRNYCVEDLSINPKQWSLAYVSAMSFSLWTLLTACSLSDEKSHPHPWLGARGPGSRGQGPGGPGGLGGPGGPGAKGPVVMVTEAYSHYFQNCPLPPPLTGPGGLGDRGAVGRGARGLRGLL